MPNDYIVTIRGKKYKISSPRPLSQKDLTAYANKLGGVSAPAKPQNGEFPRGRMPMAEPAPSHPRATTAQLSGRSAARKAPDPNDALYRSWIKGHTSDPTPGVIGNLYRHEGEPKDPRKLFNDSVFSQMGNGNSTIRLSTGRDLSLDQAHTLYRHVWNKNFEGRPDVEKDAALKAYTDNGRLSPPSTPRLGHGLHQSNFFHGAQTAIGGLTLGTAGIVAPSISKAVRESGNGRRISQAAGTWVANSGPWSALGLGAENPEDAYRNLALMGAGELLQGLSKFIPTTELLRVRELAKKAGKPVPEFIATAPEAGPLRVKIKADLQSRWNKIHGGEIPEPGQGVKPFSKLDPNYEVRKPNETRQGGSSQATKKGRGTTSDAQSTSYPLSRRRGDPDPNVFRTAAEHQIASVKNRLLRAEHTLGILKNKPVSEQAEKILKAPVSNADITIDSSYSAHVWDNHGPNSRNVYPVLPEHMDEISDTINNADRVIPGAHPGPHGAPTVVFIKRINGKRRVVTAFYEAGKHRTNPRLKIITVSQEPSH